jgi:group I intron endonuclease
MDDIGVYKIEANGGMYIGSSYRSIKSRWMQHLYQLRKGKHANRNLQSAFDEYGEDSLKFSILEIVKTPEECIIYEQKYIDELKPEYNICPVSNNRYDGSLSKIRVNMAMDEDVIAALKEIAKADRRTMTGEVEYLITERHKQIKENQKENIK